MHQNEWEKLILFKQQAMCCEQPPEEKNLGNSKYLGQKLLSCVLTSCTLGQKQGLRSRKVTPDSK